MKYLLTVLLTACLANAANAANEPAPERIQGRLTAPGLIERIRRGVSTAVATGALAVRGVATTITVVALGLTGALASSVLSSIIYHGASRVVPGPLAVGASSAVGASLAISIGLAIPLVFISMEDYFWVRGTDPVLVLPVDAAEDADDFDW